MKKKLLIGFILLLVSITAGLPQQPSQGQTNPVDKPTGFQLLNTEKSLSMASLKGHVTLLFFWTYSHLNSIHALSDMETLMKQYGDQPFQVVGVHSPKFYNEQNVDSVKAAIIRNGISFPVIVDKGHALWKRYGVQAWPTYIVISSEGAVVGRLAGEKRLKLLEPMIKQTLKQGKKKKTLTKQRYVPQPPKYPDTLLSFPAKLAMDVKNKILYIADSGHHQVVEAQLTDKGTAKILHRIGSGNRGLIDGDYTAAAFSMPVGLAWANGLLYVADMDNHAIRVLDLSAHKVSTFAGDGNYGEFGQPNSPGAVAVYNHTLYVAMSGGHQLWTASLSGEDKELELYVGNGYENFVDGSALGSSLARPAGFAVDDKDKRLFFVDADVSALRVVSLIDDSVKSIIGQGMFKYGFKDGAFAQAQLQFPLAIAYKDNRVYVADTFNHALRAADLKDGKIYTLLWPSEDKKTLINNGTKTSQQPLNEPGGLLFDGNTLYISDSNNHMIRLYDIEKKTLNTLMWQK